MQVFPNRHGVCVRVATGEDEGICGWLVSRHIGDIQQGRKVVVTIHNVKGIDGPVIQAEPVTP